jgi:hypothetical protein
MTEFCRLWAESNTHGHIDQVTVVAWKGNGSPQNLLLFSNLGNGKESRRPRPSRAHALKVASFECVLARVRMPTRYDWVMSDIAGYSS